MGFKKIKAEVIDCLNAGKVRHEERDNIEVKNLLAIGEVTVAQVAMIIARARGGDYECSPHHFDQKIDVHTIKTINGGKAWYIKWYFLEPNTIFISVH